MAIFCIALGLLSIGCFIAAAAKKVLMAIGITFARPLAEATSGMLYAGFFGTPTHYQAHQMIEAMDRATEELLNHWSISALVYVGSILAAFDLILSPTVIALH